MESLTAIKESFDLSLFLEINDGTVGDLVFASCNCTGRFFAFPVII